MAIPFLGLKLPGFMPAPFQGKKSGTITHRIVLCQRYLSVTVTTATPMPHTRTSLFSDAPPAPPEVSLGSLPVTSSELFGREGELAQLDAAWVDSQTQVFVLVAWGGLGKTALVNTWLFKHMAQNDYRGARRVFGWSFYSQGAAEGKQVSADRFVADALRWFGDPNPDEGDSIDKGRRLAALIRQQKTLLVLDGLEPLQYPPGSEEGRLKDRGLCLLLRELAAHNPGLCVITTRLALNDLQNFFNSSVRNVPLTHLSPEAGAQVLRHAGGQGPEQELRQAVAEFDGHALALNLLGRYLAVVHDGDIRKRDLIPKLTEEEQYSGHARRVIESYTCWFRSSADAKEEPKARFKLLQKFFPIKKQTGLCPELKLLYIMGLFDRPADMAAIEAVIQPLVIHGLTERLHELSQKAWKEIIRHLQDLRLLAKPHCLNRDSSDCFDGNDSAGKFERGSPRCRQPQRTVADARGGGAGSGGRTAECGVCGS